MRVPAEQTIPEVMRMRAYTALSLMNEYEHGSAQIDFPTPDM
jgi:hypothetical protein